MSAISGKNTKPEILVRKALHRAGLRFRIHVANLPGKPDIVLAKRKVVIFVNGCYWHRHEKCSFAYMPKSNSEFWAEKFQKTISRDLAKKTELERLGWSVIVVWECDLTPNALAMLVEDVKRRQ